VRAKRASKDDAGHFTPQPGASILLPRLARSPLCKKLDFIPVVFNQRFLFLATPPFDFSLNGNRVSDPIEMFGPNQSDWTTRIISPSLRL
jgi:hypothetical protein